MSLNPTQKSVNGNQFNSIKTILDSGAFITLSDFRTHVEFIVNHRKALSEIALDMILEDAMQETFSDRPSMCSQDAKNRLLAIAAGR